MAQCRVKIIRSTEKTDPTDKDWIICFQSCEYNYSDKTTQAGYRFIWKYKGKLKASRGQARLPSKKLILELIKQEEEEIAAELEASEQKSMWN